MKTLARTPEKIIPALSGLRVIRSVAEVEQIRPAWEKLQWHPNADINFFLTVIASRANVLRPHILLLEREGEPQAMLIGRLEQVPVECRLGYKVLFRPQVRALTVVHGGVLGDAAHPQAAALVDALWGSLQEGEADLVNLSELPRDSDLFLYARRRPGLLWRDWLTPGNPHWEISLPATYEEFLLRFRSKRRNDLRRNEKLFAKTFAESGQFRIFREPGEVEQLCRDAETVARRTYQRAIGAGFVGDPEHQRRLRLAAEKGWLRAYLLYAEGKLLAYEIGNLYGQSFYLDYTAYDPDYRRYEPGTLVFMKMIEDLCQSGIRRIDCGAGDAEYKARYGDKKWLESSVHLFAPNWNGFCINTLRTLSEGLSVAAGSLTRRVNLHQKIKKIWRSNLVPQHDGAGSESESCR